MVDGIKNVDWTSFAQPPWNRGDEVAKALNLLLEAYDRDSMEKSYHRVLYAVGNNHAGTYYPVVLAVIPFLFRIAQAGTRWAQIGAIEILTDWSTSFAAEPEFRTILDAEGRSVMLDQAVALAIAEGRPVIEMIAGSNAIDDELRSVVQGLLEGIDLQ